MHLQKTIEKVVGDPEEAAVYLASTSLGEATVSDIAKKAHLPRTSCYHILASLMEKGLVNFYQKRKRRYYLAENPQKFFIMIREQEAALKEAMPQLQALRSATGAKPSVSFYQGPEGINVILNNILEHQHSLCALTSIDDLMEVIGDDLFAFIEKRKKKFLRVQLLTNKTPTSFALKEKDAQELRVTRFLPENVELKTANFIYGDRVAIISPNVKTPMGIIIEDASIAATQRVLFETLWDHAGE